MFTEAVGKGGSVVFAGQGAGQIEDEGDVFPVGATDEPQTLPEVGPFAAATAGARRLGSLLWASSSPASPAGAGAATPPAPAGAPAGGGQSGSDGISEGKKLLYAAQYQMREGTFDEQVERFKRAIAALDEEGDVEGEAEAYHDLARLYEEARDSAAESGDQSHFTEYGMQYVYCKRRESELLESKGIETEASRVASDQALGSLKLGRLEEALKAARRGAIIAGRYHLREGGMAEQYILSQQMVDAKILYGRALAVEAKVLMQGADRGGAYSAGIRAATYFERSARFHGMQENWFLAARLYGEAADVLRLVKAQGSESNFKASATGYEGAAESERDLLRKEFLLRSAFEALIAAGEFTEAARVLCECADGMFQRLHSSEVVEPLYLSAAWYYLKGGDYKNALPYAARIAGLWAKEEERLRQAKDRESARPAGQRRSFAIESWEDAAIAAALARYILGRIRLRVEDRAKASEDFVAAFKILEGVRDEAAIRTKLLHFIPGGHTRGGFVYASNTLAHAAHLRLQIQRQISSRAVRG